MRPEDMLDCWRYVTEVQDRGLPANDEGYR
jgi:hypothetical protein